MTNQPTFEKKNLTVTGDQYSIKLIGQKFNEPHYHILQYIDSSVSFYFAVVRDLEVDGKTIDSKVWDIKLLWREDQSLVGKDVPIDVAHKQMTKENILDGMHVMEDFFVGRADSVKMSAN